jgi:predicted RNase H-like nuclease (RuvC/YqgF family)
MTNVDQTFLQHIQLHFEMQQEIQARDSQIEQLKKALATATDEVKELHARLVDHQGDAKESALGGAMDSFSRIRTGHRGTDNGVTTVIDATPVSAD